LQVPLTADALPTPVALPPHLAPTALPPPLSLAGVALPPPLSLPSLLGSTLEDSESGESDDPSSERSWDGSALTSPKSPSSYNHALSIAGV
jgi:hypothetical protein